MNNHIKKNFIIYFIITIAISIIITLFPYGLSFWSCSLSRSTSDWANFGSYIGGCLGPLFALLSIMLIFYAFYS